MVVGSGITICIDGLPGSMAAIHPQICTRHITTSITQQEHSCASELLGFTQPPQHILCRPIRPPFREALEKLFYHGGYDVAGGNSVYPNTMHTPFAGKVACELDDSGFGSVIGGADEAL